jgi:hypothetical protein
MTRLMSQVLSSLLVLTLAAPAAVVRAATDAPLTPPTPLRASIDRTMKAIASEPMPSAVPSHGPIQGLPRPDRSRKQMNGGGGGKTMMIMGIVGTVAGLAGTYYMVKMMKESTDAAAR